MPDLKNVPKIELELKSPPISDSEMFFNVPHLKKMFRREEELIIKKKKGRFEFLC